MEECNIANGWCPCYDFGDCRNSDVVDQIKCSHRLRINRLERAHKRGVRISNVPEEHNIQIKSFIYDRWEKEKD